MSRRLLWISEHASPLAALGGADAGGQNVYVAQVARRLAEAGDRVDVVTRRDDPDAPVVSRPAPGMRVIHVPAGPPARIRKEEMLPYMDEFSDFVERRVMGGRDPYDLVHANFFMSGLVAAELKARTGTPFVTTFHALGRVRRLHQGEVDGFPDERLAIEDRIVAESDRIIAECPQDEDDLVELYGADRSKLATVPCGVDSDEFRPLDRREARRRLGLPADVPIVLQLGRLVPRKGVDNVIRAVARLRSGRGVAARLLVVGGETREPDEVATPEIGRLRAIAAEEGASDAVTFVGGRGRAELRDYYAAADAFVSTPWYEPFGITPLEAMACGTPVIGSAVGGIKSTVLHGETGFLVPPDDPEALAGRLAALLTDPALRDAFGRRAVRHVNASYSWKRVARAISDVYDDVLGGRPAVPVAGRPSRPAWARFAAPPRC